MSQATSRPTRSSTSRRRSKMSISSRSTGRWSRRSPPMAELRRESELSEFGRHWGSAAMAERGRVANENTPKLRTFDSRGNRRDEVEFHPAYHELMAHSAHAGVHNSTWDAAGQAGRRRVRGDTRGKILHGRAGRDRASLPDHHDAGLGRGAGGAAGSAGQGDAGARHASLRSELCAVVDQARHDARHGHDREAGRHRRALQHDAGGARRRTPTASPGTNGSCRRRCATPSWCWRRPRKG